MPNWKKVLTSGSAGELSSLFAPSITGSLLGTSSWSTNAITASFSNTASYVNTLNQNVIITGSLTIGSDSVGANENTLIIGPAPAGGAGEGGQLLLSAQGGTYTSASMIDNYQNKLRILRGTNAGSDAYKLQLDLHSGQLQLPNYNSTTAFTGTTLVGILGFDASGNILTTSTSSGGGGGGVTINNNTNNYLVTATGTSNTLNGESNLQFDGSALTVTGNITASGTITAQANGAMYFRGGDDAELWDINVANTVGIYGQQDATVGSIKLGSGGGILSGWSSSIGIGTVLPNSGTLHVNGNVFATSFTGSLLGTSSWAHNAVTASYALSSLSSSYAITASYAQYALSSSYAETASFSTATTENRILVLNQSGYTINKGIVVHITASGTASDIPRVVSASYESDGFSANTLGIARETITNGSQGYVTTEGVLTGLDTSAYVSGQLIYLGAQGSITGSAPHAPLHSVRLGQVIREQGVNGSIYVRIDNGYELGELHDVTDTTTTSSYGNLLVKSGSVWTDSRQLTGSYGLTGSLSATSFTGSLLGTASYATQAGNSTTIDISSFGSPVESYLLMSNVIATTGVAVGGDSDLRYNSSTNVLTVPTISSTSITGSLFGTASWSSNSISASFASTASSVNPLNQNVIITGSVNVTQNITGSRMYLSASNSTSNGSTLIVYGSSSANPIFTVQGSQGELFSVTDQLSGSLFSVNDISGLPILEVFSDNTTLIGSYQDPMLITTTKLVTTASGAFTLYSLPTASYDAAFYEYSVRSGSNARAGSIMAIQSGSAVNFTETTTTDFGSTSGLEFTVQVNGSNMILSGSATTTGWTIKTIIRSI